MDILNKAKEIAGLIPMLQSQGIELIECGPDHAVMSVVVANQHRNYMGGAHGGLLATLVDTACFFPGPLLPSGRAVTTVSLNLNFINAASPGDTLEARSELHHLGRRTAQVSVTVTDQNSRIIVKGHAVLLLISAQTEA